MSEVPFPRREDILQRLPSVGDSLLALAGDLLLAPDVEGYRLADARAGARFRHPHAELEFRGAKGSFTAWIGSRDLDTGFFRQTGHFRIGYAGEPPDGGAYRLLDRLARLVSQREASLPAGALAAWRESGPGGLVASGGTMILRVTLRCNERCPFCQNDDETTNLVTTDEAVDDALREAVRRGLRTVAFSGGEPLLVPALPRWVARARGMGLNVQVMTNALVPAGARPWDRFVDDAGRPAMPDELCVSLHTRHAGRMKAITGVGGTFRRKVQAIRDAQGRGSKISINCVIHSQNLDELPAFPAFVAATFGTGVDLVLSVVNPMGRVAANPWVLPRVSEVVPPLRAALDECARLGLRVQVPEVCGIPLCAMPDRAACFQAGGRTEDAGPTGPDRVKGPRCVECVHDRRCIGVWRRYADRFGLDEFVPVTGGSSRSSG